LTAYALARIILNMTTNETEPTKGTLAWVQWRTKGEELSRWGHTPVVTMWTRKCSECGREVVRDSNGTHHSVE
jgi:hypothetical protein